MSTNDGGPAFPVREAERFNPQNGETHAVEQHWGMSIRQYAAIHLRVPNSGTDWLDEMIREAQRNEFAGQALIALAPEEVPWPSTAKKCRNAGDAMRDALNKPTS